MRKVINILFNDFTNDNRVLKTCRSLSRNGYEVELIATHFEKSLPQEENVENILVKRINVGRFKLLPLNLILFWLRIIKDHRKESMFHSNDLYGLPPAYIIKKFFNKEAKIVYDCHEHETEAQIYVGKPILKWFARIFEKAMISSADKVLTVSESIAQEYVEMYEIERPTLVLNCPYYREYESKDLFREELGITEDKIIFLYQGKYQPGRGLEGLVEIFKMLNEVNRDLVLVLLVFGENIEDLKELIKDIPNIYWHDKVAPDIYMNYVASADWGVHFMENTCKNHDYALPNKLFDYFMGNLPVVVSNLKEMANFVSKNKVGFVIDINNHEEAVHLLEGINKNSKEVFLASVKKISKVYTWENQEKELLKSYNSLS